MIQDSVSIGYRNMIKSLIKAEDRELQLRMVSGYTVEELTKLFLLGAIKIDQSKIPHNYVLEIQ